MAVIATRDLQKYYGSLAALKGVTLTVERGEIYGLLGQNGAGKTTLIKVLLGIVHNWQGEAKLLDETVGATAVRKRIGYLPEDHRFPDYHTAASLLDYYGTLLGQPRAQRRQRAEAMLEMVGLRTRQHAKIRTYSKGMKQRLGLAQAMAHDPEVIFLDEPTDGVDPLGRRSIREILLRLKNEGKTIFLNSHLLGEVEQVCDRVAILQRGEKIREGTVAELTRQQGFYVVGLAPGEELPSPELQQLGYSVAPEGPHWLLGLGETLSIDPVVELLQLRGLHLRHLLEKRQTLEDTFLSAVGADDIGSEQAITAAPLKVIPLHPAQGKQS